MPSVFAWVDFAEEDRRKMAEVIDLFRERDTRDELGLGVIRDGLADLLFPGTSTIQTRARYFLFIPWIYRRHEGRGTPGSEIARRARRDEDALIEALVAGGEHDGVIGIGKRSELQRPASNIYWAGLDVWRIRRFRGSQEQYRRAWDSLLRRSRDASASEDERADDGPCAVAWDPGLPVAPPDLFKQTVLVLAKEEAEYLQQRILGLGRTLLGHLVCETKPADDPEFVWLHPEHECFPEPLRTQVEHARLFSEVMLGAALLYNLMLSEERRNDEWTDDYRDRFGGWATLMNGRAEVFRSWRRDEFWALVHGTGAHVSVPARRFVDAWLDLALGTGPASALVDASAARSLIRERERVLKRSRSRLGNPRALERWNGAAGDQQVNYRWHRVRAIVNDILRGLEG
jgi:hypothetical protein